MAKPVVNGIEKDLENRARVVRLDVWDDVGGQLAQRYGVRSIPTLIVFDGKGQKMQVQTGIPDRKQVVQAVLELVQ